MGPRYALPCLVVAGVALGAAGCATSTFKLTSDPGAAEVFVIDGKSGEKKSIGRTPLEMPMATVRAALGESGGAGEYVPLVVEKAEFQPERLLVPAGRFGTLVTAVEVRLKPKPLEPERKLARDLLDRLFLAQKFALTKQYERAQIELDRLLTDAPEFPRALSMRASIFFVQKNFPESVKWYELAVKADPQLDDAVQMLAKARAQLPPGNPARAPATAPGTVSTGNGGKP